MESVTWLDTVEFSNFTLETSRIKFNSKIKLPKNDWTLVKFNNEFNNVGQFVGNINVFVGNIDVYEKLLKWLDANCKGLTLLRDFSSSNTQMFYVYFENKQEAILFKLSLEAIIQG